MRLTVADAQAMAAALLSAAGMAERPARVTARCVVMADVWGWGRMVCCDSPTTFSG